MNCKRPQTGFVPRRPELANRIALEWARKPSPGIPREDLKAVAAFLGRRANGV
jgi:hypothetical protein